MHAERRCTQSACTQSVLIRSENPCPMCGGGGFHSSTCNTFLRRGRTSDCSGLWRVGSRGVLRYAITRTGPCALVEIRPAAAHGAFVSRGHTQFSRPVPGPSPAMELPGSGREPRRAARSRWTMPSSKPRCLLHMPSSHAFFTHAFFTSHMPAHAFSVSLIHALLTADSMRRVSSLGSPRPRL